MFGDVTLGKDMHMEVTIIERTFGTIWEVESVCAERMKCGTSTNFEEHQFPKMRGSSQQRKERRRGRKAEGGGDTETR